MSSDLLVVSQSGVSNLVGGFFVLIVIAAAVTIVALTHSLLAFISGNDPDASGAAQGLSQPKQLDRDGQHPNIQAKGAPRTNSADTNPVELLREALQPQQVVLIRCRQCKRLNPEENRFCGYCGASLLD